MHERGAQERLDALAHDDGGGPGDVRALLREIRLCKSILERLERIVVTKHQVSEQGRFLGSSNPDPVQTERDRRREKANGM